MNYRRYRLPVADELSYLIKLISTQLSIYFYIEHVAKQYTRERMIARAFAVVLAFSMTISAAQEVWKKIKIWHIWPFDNKSFQSSYDISLESFEVLPRAEGENHIISHTLRMTQKGRSKFTIMGSVEVNHRFGPRDSVSNSKYFQNAIRNCGIQNFKIIAFMCR